MRLVVVINKNRNVLRREKTIMTNSRKYLKKEQIFEVAGGTALACRQYIDENFGTHDDLHKAALALGSCWSYGDQYTSNEIAQTRDNFEKLYIKYNPGTTLASVRAGATQDLLNIAVRK